MRVLASPAFVNRWLNPYNWLLNTHLAAIGVAVQGATPWRVLRGQADVWHLHWPDHVFNQRSAASAALGARAWLHLAREGRRQGLKLVWTVHNLRAHDGRHADLEGAFWRDFLPLVDGVVHLSASGRDAAEAHFPVLAERPAWVIPHGDYRHEYDTGPSRTAARRQLALPEDGPLLLSSGRLRPYKNVPALLAAFASLADDRARCLVTGAASDPALRLAVEEGARRDPRVRLDLRHLRRRELAVAHAAADLVVLPYRDILNSGSALLALSLDRPVLVPRLGALAELEAQVGDAWVRCYDGELTAGVLADAIAWARTTPRAAAAPLHAFAWPAIARAHRAAYAALLDVPSRFPPTAHSEQHDAVRRVGGPARRPRLATPGLVGT
jgi:beta-1,4-mannosyltransferase